MVAVEQTHDEPPTVEGCSSRQLSTRDDSTPEIEVSVTVENPSIHTYKFDIFVTVGGESTWWGTRTHTQFGLSTETYTHQFTVSTPLTTDNYDVDASLRNKSVVDTD